MAIPITMDAQRRQALHKEMASSVWTVDTVSGLFYLLRDASGGLIPVDDIALADYALAQQLVGNNNNMGETYPNKAQHVVALTELIDRTRATVFLLVEPHGGRISLMAYVREWKHWMVCSSGGRASCEPQVLHTIAQLAHLNIVPTFNHGVQFFCGNGGGGTAVDCVFHLYVLMKSIGHFDYRDDFATHMAQELVLLEADAKNRTDFLHHLRSLAS